MTDSAEYGWVIVDAGDRILMAWDKDEKLVFPGSASTNLRAKEVIAAIRRIQGNTQRDFFGPYDYAGTHEVAEFLGVRKQVVSNHAARRLDFPQPVVRLAMGPIYRLCDIRDWKRAEDIRRSR